MFERPVPLPVTDRSATVAAYPSLLTAGAHEAEADAAQRIAADPSVIDAERDPLYGDRVQHKTVLHRGSPAREALERAGEKWYLPVAGATMSAWKHLREPRLIEALRAWKHGTLFGCDDLWKKAAKWDDQFRGPAT